MNFCNTFFQFFNFLIQINQISERNINFSCFNQSKSYQLWNFQIKFIFFNICQFIQYFGIILQNISCIFISCLEDNFNFFRWRNICFSTNISNCRNNFLQIVKFLFSLNIYKLFSSFGKSDNIIVSSPVCNFCQISSVINGINGCSIFSPLSRTCLNTHCATTLSLPSCP